MSRSLRERAGAGAWSAEAALERWSRPLWGELARIGVDDAGVAVRRYGSGRGAYWIDDSALGPGSVVYSFGVGLDVGFERELAARGASVFAFDPSAQAQATGASLAGSSVRFVSCGIGARDGAVPLTVLQRGRTFTLATTLACRRRGRAGGDIEVARFDTLLHRLGHGAVDLVKLDVEGAEYEVLADIARAPVRQLAVQLHPHIANVAAHGSALGRAGWRRTRALVDEVRALGFAVIFVSRRGTELTLLRRRGPGGPA